MDVITYMMNVITEKTLYLGENIITPRESDGYINTTQLCKAGNREFKTYYRRQKTKKFIKVLKESVQNCTDSFFKYNKAYGNERST